MVTIQAVQNKYAVIHNGIIVKFYNSFFEARVAGDEYREGLV